MIREQDAADAESAIRLAVAIAEQDEKAYRLTMALSLLAAGVTLQGHSEPAGSNVSVTGTTACGWLLTAMRGRSCEPF